MSIFPCFARRIAGAAALTLTIAAGCPSFAQTTPAETPAPAAPAGAVSPPEPSPSALDAARDVVVASGMARSFAPMVPQLVEQIIPTVTRTRPELAKDLTEVIQNLQPEFIKDGDQMTDIAAHIFARQMTESELKDTAVFFNSPVGKKYVDIQPAMLDQLVVAMQSWTQQLSTTMMLRVRQEMVKKGHTDF